jgi:GH15 family glucan-1,4-alpha-glucosidase
VIGTNGSGGTDGHRRPADAGLRTDGFAPIDAYGVIGDGRVAALVAADGAIDWLCLPDLSGPAVLWALLDPDRGGSWTLAPTTPHTARQRYLPDTNVLQTTFTTADGEVTVTDACTLQEGRLLPWVEVVRRIEGVHGTVPLAWRLTPRFDFGRSPTRWQRERGHPVARGGGMALTLLVDGDGDGDPRLTGGTGLAGEVSAAGGTATTLCLAAVADEPLVFPHLDQVTRRLDGTADFWSQRAASVRYEGRWRDAVVRSALALQLMIQQRSGGIAAAVTMGLPERVGGSANYDYRFQWVRDASFILDAFVGIGLQAQAHASFTALQHATRHTHPRLQPMYRLDGSPRLPDQQLDVRGYRDSRPVRVGNGAAGQLQLGNFGDLLDMTWRFVDAGHVLDAGTARRTAQVADLVTALWRCDDSGIWELRDAQRAYTNSKMACWLALDRAGDLATHGRVPDGRVDRWRTAQRAIREFVEDRCWSPRRRSYTMHPDTADLDASVLLAARMGYAVADADRLRTTVDAVRGELCDGPFVYRYSGMREREGAFLAASFWLAEALALTGRVDQAAEQMDRVVRASGPTGLLSEEIDPSTGDLLGNLPQGLSHLALINAALVLARAGVS